VLELDDVRSRLHLLQVELTDPLDVIEDRGQLTGHPLDLGLAQAQPGQASHVEHLIPLDHAAIVGLLTSRPASDGSRLRACSITQYAAAPMLALALRVATAAVPASSAPLKLAAPRARRS